MKIGIITSNTRHAVASEPFAAIQAALTRLGHDVYLSTSRERVPFSVDLDACFIWGGGKHLAPAIVDGLRSRGTRMLFMERGFFDRERYTQIDTEGFNHTASWCNRNTLYSPAPADGLARFIQAFGQPPTPVTSAATNKGGSILVIGQCPDDAQLAECEIQDTRDLAEAVRSQCQHIGIHRRIIYRPHPLCGVYAEEKGQLRNSVPGTTLRDEVAKAAIVVTVNSNAGNEALAWGCPVVCLGPATYAVAGACFLSGLSHIGSYILAAIETRRWDNARTSNYLYHLACRQWNAEELAAGFPLVKLLAER